MFIYLRIRVYLLPRIVPHLSRVKNTFSAPLYAAEEYISPPPLANGTYPLPFAGA